VTNLGQQFEQQQMYLIDGPFHGDSPPPRARPEAPRAAEEPQEWNGRSVRYDNPGYPMSTYGEGHEYPDHTSAFDLIGAGRIPHFSQEGQWDRHSRVEEVVVPTLRSAQGEVSSNRVKELFHHPERAKRDDLGGDPDLPKVVRQWVTGDGSAREDEAEEQVLDGNHRTVAAHRRGQMFMQARVMEPWDEPEDRPLRAPSQFSFSGPWTGTTDDSDEEWDPSFQREGRW
jgi:hypothetical protein